MASTYMCTQSYCAAHTSHISHNHIKPLKMILLSLFCYNIVLFLLFISTFYSLFSIMVYSHLYLLALLLPANAVTP